MEYIPIVFIKYSHFNKLVSVRKVDWNIKIWVFGVLGFESKWVVSLLDFEEECKISNDDLNKFVQEFFSSTGDLRVDV